MGDDAATVELLRAENARLRAEIASLREENKSQREREAALVDAVEQRDRAAAGALAQQAATAEILRVMASSASDLPSVLQAVVQSARDLSGSRRAVLWIRQS
jgi:hypothetical protein